VHDVAPDGSQQTLALRYSFPAILGITLNRGRLPSARLTDDATSRCPGFASLAALIAGIVAALAPMTAAAVFVVNLPWARPAGEGRTSEVYMALTSTEGATLVDVKCGVAKRVVIIAAGDRSAAIERLPLPKGDAVTLEPGGNRLRLVGLSHALKLGDRVSLVLTLEYGDGTRQEIPVDAEVRRRSAFDDHLHGHAR